jgi:hypothetical protein
MSLIFLASFSWLPISAANLISTSLSLSDQQLIGVGRSCSVSVGVAGVVGLLRVSVVLSCSMSLSLFWMRSWLSWILVFSFEISLPFNILLHTALFKVLFDFVLVTHLR